MGATTLVPLCAFVGVRGVCGGGGEGGGEEGGGGGRVLYMYTNVLGRSVEGKKKKKKKKKNTNNNKKFIS